jgi:protein-S-isoprenylcysteine O-methyltransferase Ste14
MRNKAASLLLVAVQIAAITLLLATGPLIAHPKELLLLEVLAVLLAIWGIVSMRRSRLNIFPDVLAGSTLISKGPYRVIRHPMYVSLIIFSLALLLTTFSIFRLGVVLLLTVNLFFKIEFEEKLLQRCLSGYTAYMGKTWKLIPFVY